MRNAKNDIQVAAFPDLSGKWVGFLNSSYKHDGRNMIVPVTLEITHAASSISVRACFEGAASNSLIAGLEMINDKPHLCYMYDNTLPKKAQGSVNRHRGAVILEYLERDGKRVLKGNYFNDLRPVPNHGEIKVTFLHSKI